MKSEDKIRCAINELLKAQDEYEAYKKRMEEISKRMPVLRTEVARTMKINGRKCVLYLGVEYSLREDEENPLRVVTTDIDLVMDP